MQIPITGEAADARAKVETREHRIFLMLEGVPLGSTYLVCFRCFTGMYYHRAALWVAIYTCLLA